MTPPPEELWTSSGSEEDGGEHDQMCAPGVMVLKQMGQSGASSVLDAPRAKDAMSLCVRSICSLEESNAARADGWARSGVVVG